VEAADIDVDAELTFNSRDPFAIRVLFSVAFAPADGQRRGGGLIDQFRVDGVHQPRPDLPDRRSQNPRMATVISNPTTGSAHRQPIATPPAPSRTARLVNPSVRACRPSATSVAEPICRPTRIR